MKKIALVSDVKGWAFDIAANIIKNNLSDKFHFDIFYSKSDKYKKDLFLILEDLKDYDVIHFFWRKILLDFEEPSFKKRVIKKYGNYEKYVKNMIKKISTGVYDHLFENDLQFNQKFTKYCNNYVVSSKKLFNIYSSMNKIKKPKFIMGDSFEKEKFFPINLERFNNQDKTLVIGWAGNSAWNSKEKNINGEPKDFKGFNTILKPVIQDLISNGYNIKLELADSAIKQIPNECMCEFYSNLDIYICVSEKEGTPKPILEAMGCAVPIISTDVGVVNEAFGVKQKDFILGERILSKNDCEIKNKLKEKIIYLYNNRNCLKELSNENYISSKKYEIQNMKKIYSAYFNEKV